jgi:hypothetical protein
VANFINQDFFVRKLLIAGVEKPAIYQVLCQFIAEYEPKFLEKCLGIDLYDGLVTGVAGNPTEGKWFDLMFGADYTFNGVTKRWHGLKSKSAQVNQSIIANYVYYYYMLNEVTQTGTVGQVKSNNENGESSTPGYKMQTAWNDMSEQVLILWEFLRSKTDEDGEIVYTEFNYAYTKKQFKTHFLPIDTFNF